MKIAIPRLSITNNHFLRQCGYHLISSKQTKETSYVRNLNAGRFYPRFHIYIIEESTERSILNMHLDAKEPSYQGTSAHSGEYTGELVEAEANRIQVEAKNLIKTQQPKKIGLSKQSWWEKIFGL